MHAFLIVGNETQRSLKIDALLAERGITTFDRVYAQSESGTSIGVSDIRRFTASLSLSPRRSVGQAGIIANGELLTTEAQQAMLKTLEEPPPGTLLYIGISNAPLLLETIVSRCTIVSVSSHQDIAPDDTVAAEVHQLITGNPGSILHTVSTIGKTRTDLITWIDTAIQSLRIVLISEAKSSNRSPLFIRKTNVLRRLLESKQHLKNNVSPYLLVDRACISAQEKNETV